MCDTGSSVGRVAGVELEEAVGSLVSGVCVFVFGELDQSEVVFETVVRAPNLLNQLPSALTDAASFLDFLL